MLTPVQAVLLDALRYLRDEGPRHPDSGICYNVEDVVYLCLVAVPQAAVDQAKAEGFHDDYDHAHVDSAVYSALGKTFQALGLSKDYPVPGGEAMYYRESNAEAMWDRNTEYGRARWALLDQVINHLEQQAS